LLEWYKLHRAHELELNKATLAYELELAKLFLLMNGAAAGAFLTLIGTVWKDGPRPSYGLVASAIASWLAGLAAAAIATYMGYEGQREYTRAYLYRRRGIEAKLIQHKNLTLNVEIEPKDLGLEVNEDYAKRANEAVEAARSWVSLSASSSSPTRAAASSSPIRKFFRRSKLSWARIAAVGFFILGVLLALGAFYGSWTSPSSASYQKITHVLGCC
jgi:hypothetical protein